MHGINLGYIFLYILGNYELNVILNEAKYAYEYALKVNELPLPKEKIRVVACKDPKYAYLYAKDVDKNFHEDTWMAVEGTKYEEEYNRFLNQIEKDKII